MLRRNTTVDRRAFIRKWMDECGFTYDVACRIYASMVGTFEDGIAGGQKITIGNLGSLTPKISPAREVTKGFDMLPGRKVVPARKTYYLDERIRYSFKIYQKWLDTHELKWW